jgi:hypothetical protein
LIDWKRYLPCNRPQKAGVMKFGGAYIAVHRY